MNYSDVGIDLGTASILVYIKGKGVVLKEPSVVAFDRDTNKIKAIGEDARLMIGSTPGNIVAVRPLRQGVISNYTVTEQMMKYFIVKAMGRKSFRKPRIAVCVPSGVTEVEKKAVEDATYQAGAREVAIIEEPIAAAIGAGIDISKPQGNMIVDIGGGTTEISVVSSGGISEVSTLKFGGDDFTDALIRYVRRRYNIELGDVSAEESKIDGASLVTGNEADTFEIKGKNLLNGLPVKLEITTNETVPVFREVATQISDAIAAVLDVTEPELVSDITKEGILLAGGASVMPGMAKFIGEKTGLKIITGDNPGDYVALGAGSAGEYITIEDSIRK